VAGPVGEEWTWLRLAVRRGDDGEVVTAWTSHDGEAWVRGATWTHDLGEMQIGLLPMGGPGGHTARFDYLRAFELE
jgi:arabinan endo-1,5-alpha-L-arabinosidase